MSRILWFLLAQKKEKNVFIVLKLISANVNISIHKFFDFFVLTVKPLAELVVIKGFKSLHDVVDHAFGENIVLRENVLLFLQCLSGLVAGSWEVFKLCKPILMFIIKDVYLDIKLG